MADSDAIDDGSTSAQPYSLIPVDHDPLSNNQPFSLVPVDHDPFAAGSIVNPQTTPDSVLRVDLDGLRKAGKQIPPVTQVAREYGMPGGGTEMQFPYKIPPYYIQEVPK